MYEVTAHTEVTFKTTLLSAGQYSESTAKSTVREQIICPYEKFQIGYIHFS